MAVIKKNPLVKGATGMIGNTYYLRESFGEQQIVNRPRKRKSSTENELRNQYRFKMAGLYAKKQIKNPEIEKEYAKGVNPRSRSSYHVALNDFLHAPTVDYINVKLYTGAVGDTITIKAQDDFKVVRVSIEIYDTKGELLEHGDAVRYIYKPFIWKYKASMINRKLRGTVVQVVAFDRPGNRGTHEVVL
ncbi:hypothetical protein BH09BAC3_BH09BAC3_34050 [soil metagenome]